MQLAHDELYTDAGAINNRFRHLFLQNFLVACDTMTLILSDKSSMESSTVFFLQKLANMSGRWHWTCSIKQNAQRSLVLKSEISYPLNNFPDMKIDHFIIAQ